MAITPCPEGILVNMQVAIPLSVSLSFLLLKVRRVWPSPYPFQKNMKNRGGHLPIPFRKNDKPGRGQPSLILVSFLTWEGRWPSPCSLRKRIRMEIAIPLSVLCFLISERGWPPSHPLRRKRKNAGGHLLTPLRKNGDGHPCLFLFRPQLLSLCFFLKLGKEVEWR